MLILLAVAGGLAVGIGIIWEAERGGHLWTLPTAFVFFGVVVEAAATVILFEFDEGISRSQQSTIISLNRQIAPRKLNDEQLRHVIDTLRPYPNIPYDMDFSGDLESLGLLLRLGAVFNAPSLGWTAQSVKNALVYSIGSQGKNINIGVSFVFGVHIAYGASHEDDFGPAARALAGALTDQGKR